MYNNQIKFLFYALGIFLCYFYYGIVQEQITRGTYGNETQPDNSTGERFRFAMELVWVQCVCNSIFAKGILLVIPQNEDTTHIGYYVVCSLMYLLGMVSSNMALRWVSFPTQVIAKSAKPIPVMILAVLIGRKSYSLIRYGCVLLIVAGVVLFMYKDNQPSSGNSEHTGLGQFLISLSLAMDGLLGAVQERMRASSAPSGPQMMLAMNLWSTIMLSGALLIKHEVIEFIAFAIKYPNLIVNLSTLTLAGALGQLFIFLMVSVYGPLACSVVTTTRKFFTVLCSVLWFGNVLTTRQWIGTVLVFCGLFADIFFGKKTNSTREETTEPEITSENAAVLN